MCPQVAQARTLSFCKYGNTVTAADHKLLACVQRLGLPVSWAQLCEFVKVANVHLLRVAAHCKITNRPCRLLLRQKFALKIKEKTRKLDSSYFHKLSLMDGIPMEC